MFGAIGLGGVAVYLVVVGHTQKQVQIGLLVGLWGVMLGAFTLFGPRHTAADDAGEQGDDGSTWVSGQGELVSAERREHELQLEVILRREMERVLRGEMAELRGEVAGLRTDLLDKMNGQLRLERVETTRVISSDIDELQHEVRRLAVAHSGAPALGGGQAYPPATLVDSSPVSPSPSHASGPLPYVVGAPQVAQGLPASSAPRPVPSPAPAPRPSIAAARPATTVKPPAPPRRPMPAPANANPVAESPRPAAPSTSWSAPASVAPRKAVAAPAASPLPPAQASWRLELPEPNLVKSVSENVTNVLPDVPARQPLSKPEPMRLGEAPHVAELPRVSELPRIGHVPRLTPPTPILPPASLPSAAVPPPAHRVTPAASDPFAAMPRLSRYEADEWDDAPLPPAAPLAQQPAREPSESRPRPNQYVGRRRQPNGSPAPHGASGTNGTNGVTNGTPAINGTPAMSGPPPVNSGPAPYSPPAANGSYPAPGTTGRSATGDDPRAAGGRRRRADGDADDVLARLLGR
jgi:hypothetical protein